MTAQRGNLVGMQQVGALAHSSIPAPSTSSGFDQQTRSIADISPKTQLAPCCAVPLLSAVSLLLLSGSIIPNPLRALIYLQ